MCIRDRDIPIAATETTRGAHWGVAQSIAQNAADIVRADVSWKCGITGTLKIAHMADAFGLNCEIHTTTMNYMDLVLSLIHICSGQVTEGYLQETAAPLVLGRDPHDRCLLYTSRCV